MWAKQQPKAAAAAVVGRLRSFVLYTLLHTTDQTELWEMWQFSSSTAANAAQFNGFMSPEQHGINFVQVTAGGINWVLEDSLDQASSSAVTFR